MENMLKIKNIGKHPIYLPQVAGLPAFLREDAIGVGSSIELSEKLVMSMCKFDVFEAMVTKGDQLFVWDPSDPKASADAAAAAPSRESAVQLVAIPPGYELVTLPDGSKAYAPRLVDAVPLKPSDAQGAPLAALAGAMAGQAAPASDAPANPADFTAAVKGAAKSAK